MYELSIWNLQDYPYDLSMLFYALLTVCLWAEKPQITIIPSEYVDLREGDELVLKCTSSGQPRPSVVWEKQSDDDIGKKKIFKA